MAELDVILVFYSGTMFFLNDLFHLLLTHRTHSNFVLVIFLKSGTTTIWGVAVTAIAASDSANEQQLKLLFPASRINMHNQL